MKWEWKGFLGATADKNTFKVAGFPYPLFPFSEDFSEDEVRYIHSSTQRLVFEKSAIHKRGSEHKISSEEPYPITIIWLLLPCTAQSYSTCKAQVNIFFSVISIPIPTDRTGCSFLLFSESFVMVLLSDLNCDLSYLSFHKIISLSRETTALTNI